MPILTWRHTAAPTPCQQGVPTAVEPINPIKPSDEPVTPIKPSDEPINPKPDAETQPEKEEAEGTPRTINARRKFCALGETQAIAFV